MITVRNLEKNFGKTSLRDRFLPEILYGGVIFSGCLMKKTSSMLNTVNSVNKYSEFKKTTNKLGIKLTYKG